MQLSDTTPHTSNLSLSTHDNQVTTDGLLKPSQVVTSMNTHTSWGLVGSNNYQSIQHVKERSARFQSQNCFVCPWLLNSTVGLTKCTRAHTHTHTEIMYTSKCLNKTAYTAFYLKIFTDHCTVFKHTLASNLAVFSH